MIAAILPSRPRRRLRDPGTLPPRSRTFRWPMSADGRSVQVQCSRAPPVRPVEQGTAAMSGHHRDGCRGCSTAPRSPDEEARRAVTPTLRHLRQSEGDAPNRLDLTLSNTDQSCAGSSHSSSGGIGVRQQPDRHSPGWWRPAGVRGCTAVRVIPPRFPTSPTASVLARPAPGADSAHRGHSYAHPQEDRRALDDVST